MAQTQKELTAKKAVLVKRLSKLRKIFQRYGLRTTAREIGQVIDRLKRIKVAKPSAKGAKPKAIEAVPARAKAVGRKRMNTVKFFSQLFKNNWKQFFKARIADYKLFIRKTGVKDSTLVRKQWTAAWMTYRIFRYGGTAGINFKYVHERKGVKALKVAPGVRSKKAIEGKEFSVMLKDIVTGSKYTDPKSEKKGSTYTTFGDCDESSLLIAQVLRAMSKENNLGLNPGVYRVDAPHANTTLKIGGKWFLLEPSKGEISYPKLLAKALKNEIDILTENKSFGSDMQRVRAALARLRSGKPPTPLYDDNYEKQTAPKLAAILKNDAAIPKISGAQQIALENAAKKAYAVSSAQGTIERETLRRKWGYRPQRRSSTIKNKFLPTILKQPGGRKKALIILTNFVAASAKGPFKKNRAEIKSMLKGRTIEQQLKTLTRISTNMDLEKKYTMDYVRKVARA
jgi:hypothetical protein